jgi:2-iminobutanoate/2-iminopropanoate deaminase
MGKEHAMQGSQGVIRYVTSGEGLPASHSSYSPAVVHGSTVYISGQAAFDPSTGELVEGGIAEQTERTLQNLLLVAAAAGARPGDALRLNVHLSELDDFEAYDEVYRRYFSDPYPTRVTVGSQLLDGMLIEVDAIFALPDGAGSPAK